MKNIQFLLSRDLNKLKEELSAYDDETLIWKIDKNISNSAGNLCLHIIGNLNHFIGAVLGNTGYQRNREQEFSVKDMSRERLIGYTDFTIKMINDTLNQIPESDYKKTYPQKINDMELDIESMMIYLTVHLSYHLGQINYHRRLITA